MLQEAQSLKLKKPKNIPLEDEATLKTYLDQRIIDIEKKQYFEANKSKEYLPEEIYYDLYDIDKKNKENNNKRYGLGLFTENEERTNLASKEVNYIEIYTNKNNLAEKKNENNNKEEKEKIVGKIICY